MISKQHTERARRLDQYFDLWDRIQQKDGASDGT